MSVPGRAQASLKRGASKIWPMDRMNSDNNEVLMAVVTDQNRCYTRIIAKGREGGCDGCYFSTATTANVCGATALAS